MAPLFHNDTSKQLSALISSATQAVLIMGEKGSGTLTAAKTIAGDTLIDIVQPTDVKGGVDLDKGSVRIVQIRAIGDRVKTASKAIETVIIDNADTMGINAQNAFLKLLEEPRANLRFILTAHSASSLLPTILSRVQKLQLLPLSQQQSQRLVSELGINEEKKIKQILYLGQGLPAEITRLASDEDYFEHQSALAGDARLFLQGSIAEKTIVANRYHAQRASALSLLSLVRRMLTHSLSQKASVEIVSTLERTARAHEAISVGGNVRLHLLTCVV